MSSFLKAAEACAEGRGDAEQVAKALSDLEARSYIVII